MNALGQEAQALIDSVSALDDPSSSDKSRVRARIAAQLGVAAFATLGATLVSSSATDAALASSSVAVSGAASQSAGWPLLNKLALAGAALGVTIGALWLTGGNERTQTPRAQVAAKSATAAPAPAAHLGTASAPRATDESAAAAAPSRAANDNGDDLVLTREKKRVERKSEPAAVVAPAAPPPASTLGLELKLLGEAQAALRAGAPERALVLTAEHRANFPEGVMKEERLGIEALAGCALGRDYRAQAEAFLRIATSSPLRARVQRACGIKP